MSISKSICALLAGAAAFFAGAPAFALCSSQGLDLMKSLDGSWRGKGAVTPIGGAPEFIACKVSYSMGGADVIRQVIACAGTDYRVEVASRVTCEGNRLEGLFEENIAHSQGLVRGSISGSNLLIEAESPVFKGNFNVTFRAGNHLVAITQYDSNRRRQVPVASIKMSR
jgi:hypothetical protein